MRGLLEVEHYTHCVLDVRTQYDLLVQRSLQSLEQSGIAVAE